MENTNTQVAVETLSDAEKALILAERNRKAAEEAEKIAKQNLEKAGKIEKMKQSAAEFVATRNALKVATQDFFTDLNYNLPNGFKLIATPHTQTFEAKNCAWRGEDVVIYDTMTVNYETFRIESVKQYDENAYNRIYIDVEFYNGAYRLSIHGINDSDRHYKKASTVVEKINDFFVARQNEINRKKQTETLAERAWAAVKAKHTDAVKIEAGKYEHYYQASRYRRELSSITNYVTATFVNGACISYTYSETANSEIKLSIYNYNMSSIDPEALINFLTTAPKKSS